MLVNVSTLRDQRRECTPDVGCNAPLGQTKYKHRYVHCSSDISPSKLSTDASNGSPGSQIPAYCSSPESELSTCSPFAGSPLRSNKDANDLRSDPIPPARPFLRKGSGTALRSRTPPVGTHDPASASKHHLKAREAFKQAAAIHEQEGLNVPGSTQRPSTPQLSKRQVRGQVATTSSIGSSASKQMHMVGVRQTQGIRGVSESPSRISGRVSQTDEVSGKLKEDVHKEASERLKALDAQIGQFKSENTLLEKLRLQLEYAEKELESDRSRLMQEVKAERKAALQSINAERSKLRHEKRQLELEKERRKLEVADDRHELHDRIHKLELELAEKERQLHQVSTELRQEVSHLREQKQALQEKICDLEKAAELHCFTTSNTEPKQGNAQGASLSLEVAQPQTMSDDVACATLVGDTTHSFCGQVVAEEAKQLPSMRACASAGMQHEMIDSTLMQLAETEDVQPASSIENETNSYVGWGMTDSACRPMIAEEELLQQSMSKEPIDAGLRSGVLASTCKQLSAEECSVLQSITDGTGLQHDATSGSPCKQLASETATHLLQHISMDGDNTTIRHGVSDSVFSHLAAEESRTCEGILEHLPSRGQCKAALLGSLHKVKHADGRVSVTFQNGDVKETFPDGHVMYHYFATKTVQMTYQDGTNVYHFANGQVERYGPDGVRIGEEFIA